MYVGVQKISNFPSVGIEMDLHISRFLCSDVYFEGTFVRISKRLFFLCWIISMPFLVSLTSVREVFCGRGRKMNNHKGLKKSRRWVGKKFWFPARNLCCFDDPRLNQRIKSTSQSSIDDQRIDQRINNQHCALPFVPCSVDVKHPKVIRSIDYNQSADQWSFKQSNRQSFKRKRRKDWKVENLILN